MSSLLTRMIGVVAWLLGLSWATALRAQSDPATLSHPQEIRRVSLNGSWKFAPDYLNRGDAVQWFSPTYADGVWDQVQVPHTWSHDPRFVGFIGAGWYRLRLTAPAVAPGEHVRLAFGGVFARARVWLNGEFLGEHEGGYTPFEFDVTSRLLPGAENLIVVCADNRWTRDNQQIHPQHQVYAWWDDGGIIREVELLIGPAVYVVRQKVEALPDLTSGSAEVRTKVWVRNTTNAERLVRVTAEMAREDEWLPAVRPNAPMVVGAGETVLVELHQALAREHVTLWQLDAPVLYQWRTTIEGGARETVRFGIRRFEVKGTRLALNGHPIRLAGANRHASYPGGGQDEPLAVVTRDLQLMKEAGLVFQRLSHYPVATSVLDWADRNGLLLIAEAGNTGWTAAELDSPVMREQFKQAHREMMERDWNRPSIIAWSVGNEYAADTPAGVRWTTDMRDYTREVDSTRLVTFASNTVAKPGIKPGEEGSAYVDFVCLNTYGATPSKNAENIDRTHARHPDKPLIVTEYGIRHDFVEDETVRVEWFREMTAIIRARPFISGASVWSFNDYRSRYVGTNVNGWREWGLVDPERKPRGSYHVLRRDHSGFVVRQATMEAGTLRVRMEPRLDFPVFPPAVCQLRVSFTDGQNRLLGTTTVPVRTDAPMSIPLPPGAGGFRAEIWRGGFRTGTFGRID